MKKIKIGFIAFFLLAGTAILLSRTDGVQALYADEENVRIEENEISAQAFSRYPAEREFTEIPQGNLPQPDYFDSVMDDRFRTRITRITDKAVYNAYGDTVGYVDYHPVQPYPKNQAWNNDGTYLRIGNTLLNGKTYEIVKDIEGHIFERKWSYTNPNYIYGISRDADNYYFVRQDVRMPEYENVEKLESFSRAVYDEVYMGPWEGNISFDDTLVALSARKNNDLIIILYNIQTDTILKTKTFADIWDRLDWISISPLGNYVLMNWITDTDPPEDDEAYAASIDQYDLDLNFVRRLANQGQHGDMGIDANGNEVYVQFEFWGASGDRRGIWSYRLDDGSEIEILPEKYNGGHVSCRNYERPGWCYLTTAQDGFAEVIAVKLDGSGIVNRFGQTYIAASEGAQGAPNPDGTKVVFKSDWGDENAELDVFIAETNLPAFPGAEGGGASAKGGRGGRVIEVTNLNDSGPGSLRAALEETGSRTVIFKVSGIIDIETPIMVNSYVTVAGQTAPGGGILLRSHSNIPDQQPLLAVWDEHDIIIRYLRFRTGSNVVAGDNIAIEEDGHNIIIDHCSLSWATDENFSVWTEAQPGYNVTISNNIIAEGLAEHSCGAIYGTNTDADNMKNFAIHHNFFAHNNNRNPLVKVASADISNNIIYGWDWWATGLGGGISVDIIGNKYVYQDMGSLHRRDILWKPYYNDPDTGVNGEPSIYFENNLGSRDVPDPNSWENMLEMTDKDHWGWPDDDGSADQTPVPVEYRRYTVHDLEFPITIHNPNDLDTLLLGELGAGASGRLDENGAWHPNRDAVDIRIIDEYFNNTGTIPPSEDDVGGYPLIENGTAYTDSDHDGMPDVWEDTYGLDKNDPADAVLDNDNDGYDNLEEFLNSTPPVCIAPPNDDFSAAIDLNLASTVETNTCGATQENSDPLVSNCGLNAGKATVWYKYTPATDSAISLDTKNTDYDTFIAVWTGSQGNLIPVACNDDVNGTLQSALAFHVLGGTTYYIEIGEWDGPGTK